MDKVAYLIIIKRHYLKDSKQKRELLWEFTEGSCLYIKAGTHLYRDSASVLSACTYIIYFDEKKKDIKKNV